MLNLDFGHIYVLPNKVTVTAISGLICSRASSASIDSDPSATPNVVDAISGW